MLTLDSILKTTRQMTAYGEVYPGGGRAGRRPDERLVHEASVACERPVRVWDDENMVYRHAPWPEAPPDREQP